VSDPTTTTGAEGACALTIVRIWEHNLLHLGEHTPRERAEALGVNLADYLAAIYPGYQPNPITIPPEPHVYRRKPAASTARNARRRLH
jgi:hypothetical protein